MTRTVTLAAAAGYATGYAIGALICWAAWVSVTHEHVHWKGWAR